MNEYTGGIYEIKNEITGTVYIGSSRNIEKRIKDHQRRLKQNKHHNRRLQSDYDKGDTFTYNIVRKILCDNPKELKRWEIKEITERRTRGEKLYNSPITTIGAETYLDKNQLIERLANAYCREKYNLSLGKFLEKVPAEREMYVYISENPEKKEDIERAYSDIIKYQNMEKYCKNQFHMTYEEYNEIPEQKREELKRRKYGIQSKVQ